jgi:hypothetical protein
MVNLNVPEDMHCDTYLLHAYPIYEIIQFARAEQIDLIGGPRRTG